MVGPFIFLDQMGPEVLSAGKGLDVVLHQHSRSILHARADCSREISLHRLPTSLAPKQRHLVLGYSQLRWHNLPDLLAEVTHDLSGG